jgi:hypothetical protein
LIIATRDNSPVSGYCEKWRRFSGPGTPPMPAPFVNSRNTVSEDCGGIKKRQQVRSFTDPDWQGTIA